MTSAPALTALAAPGPAITSAIKPYSAARGTACEARLLVEVTQQIDHDVGGSRGVVEADGADLRDDAIGHSLPCHPVEVGGVRPRASRGPDSEEARRGGAGDGDVEDRRRNSVRGHTAGARHLDCDAAAGAELAARIRLAASRSSVGDSGWRERHLLPGRPAGRREVALKVDDQVC